MASTFANIFGTSPVKPLEEHCEIAYQCARQLTDFFEAVIGGDWGAATAVHQKIVDLENDADDLKKQIRQHLPKSLFMPVPREDLLQLLLVQDRIANRAKDVSGLVMFRQMQIPEQVAGEFQEFVDRIVDAAKQARKSVRELDELFTSGFRGAEAKLVDDMIDKLDRIESDTDQRQADLSKSVFAIEKTLDPVDAVFLYRVITLIGEVADMAERVGRRLELLLSN